MARHLKVKHMKEYDEYKKQMKLKEIETDTGIINYFIADLCFKYK